MASQADEQMELAISRMLRAGVSLAAAVVLAGSCLYVAQRHGVAPDYRHFHGIVSPADRMQPLYSGGHWDSRSLIRLGILLLIATPVLRVAFCVYSFARQRDLLYVAVSSVVLLVLVYSFFRF